MGSLDNDNDVPDMLSNMLKMHKEHDDQGHEDVETDATRDKDGSMDNHDQTLFEGMITKNESNLLVYATNRKEYKLITRSTQFVKGRSTHIEENVDMEQVVADKSSNSMIFTDEGGSIHDCISFLGTIRLSPRLSVFLKFKLYQTNLYNGSLNRY